MPQKSPKITINLSSKKVGAKDIAYKWMVDAGRGIIVLIELLALGALSYRFVIDGKIVDLKENIRVQEDFISRQESQEKLFRGIQDRLANIKQTSEDTNGKISIMNTILQDIKSGTFTSTTLSVNQSSINLSGSTFSIFTLNSFVNVIKQYPNVTAINIDEINTGDQGLKFKLTIQLKELLINKKG